MKVFQSLLVGAFVTTSLCSTTTPASQLHEVPPEVQSNLITLATSDFTKHGPPVDSVRRVHLRYKMLQSGERTYMLCGQFRIRSTKSESQWTDFATIKTDPYEHWIGGMAKALCDQATAAASPPQELSTPLEARLGASTP